MPFAKSVCFKLALLKMLRKGGEVRRDSSGIADERRSCKAGAEGIVTG
jgi:hypothetical protein